MTRSRKRSGRSRSEWIRRLESAARSVQWALHRVLVASRVGEGIGYLLAVLLLLFPTPVVGHALNWALARENPWVGLVAVLFAAVLLILFAGMMANERFLRGVRDHGLPWPSALSVVLAWLAVLVFGGLSCGFQRYEIVDIAPQVAPSDGCATKYADMYLWQLADSIPGIRFTETVGWTQRYTYSDALSGWLMLFFKILVIVSVIGSFVIASRLRRETAQAGTAKKRGRKSGR